MSEFLPLGDLGFKLVLGNQDGYKKDAKGAEEATKSLMTRFAEGVIKGGLLVSSLTAIKNSITGVSDFVIDCASSFNTFVESSGKIIDDAGKMAATLGLTTSELGSLQLAFASVGIGAQEMQAAVARLSEKALEDFNKKSELTAKTLDSQRAITETVTASKRAYTRAIEDAELALRKSLATAKTAEERDAAQAEYTKKVARAKEDYADACGKASQKLTELNEQATKSRSVFDKLGISVVDSSGRLKTSGQLFYEIADAVASIQNPATRTALVMEVFGRGAAKLVPLLSQGSTYIRKFQADVESLGLAYTDSERRLADMLESEGLRLDTAFKALKMRTSRYLIGPLAEVKKELADCVIEFVKWGRQSGTFERGAGLLTQALGWVSGRLSVLKDVISGGSDKMQGFIRVGDRAGNVMNEWGSQQGPPGRMILGVQQLGIAIGDKNSGLLKRIEDMPSFMSNTKLEMDNMLARTERQTAKDKVMQEQIDKSGLSMVSFGSKSKDVQGIFDKMLAWWDKAFVVWGKVPNELNTLSEKIWKWMGEVHHRWESEWWPKITSWPGRLKLMLQNEVVGAFRSAFAEIEAIVWRTKVTSDGAMGSVRNNINNTIRSTQAALADVMTRMAGSSWAPSPYAMSPMPTAGPGGMYFGSAMQGPGGTYYNSQSRGPSLNFGGNLYQFNGPISGGGGNYASIAGAIAHAKRRGAM